MKVKITAKLPTNKMRDVLPGGYFRLSADYERSFIRIQNVTTSLNPKEALWRNAVELTTGKLHWIEPDKSVIIFSEAEITLS